MKSQTLLKPPVRSLLDVFDRRGDKFPRCGYGTCLSSGCE
jgi:hypothetical protein